MNCLSLLEKRFLLSKAYSNNNLSKITGKHAMANIIKNIPGVQKSMFVFDFDKTITNGLLSNRDPTIDNLIRGGMKTATVLNYLKYQNIPMCILTARDPTLTEVENLKKELTVIDESLTNTNISISDIFYKSDSPNLISEVYGVKIFQCDNIYACGFNKGETFKLIMDNFSDKDITDIYYFDDNIYNVIDVASNTIKNKTLHCYWWDCFDEYVSKEMIKDVWAVEDFSYKKEYLEFLKEFGIDEQMRKQRDEIFNRL